MKCKAILAFVAVTYVLAGAALVTTPQPAKADDEKVRVAVQKTRLGRTTGMTLEEALKVAVDCVNKAAGFKAISETDKIMLNRVEDKLEFVGITDATRLNALRRYLVRNEEIGTQQVPREENIDPTHRRFYRYMITSHDLLGVKKDWTLLKLAQLIVDKAGIAKMPETTARAILADCRVYAGDKDPVNIPTPAPPTPTPTPTPLTDAINTSLPNGITVDDFAQCVVKSERYGVRGVGFDSTKGDSLGYFIELIPPPPTVAFAKTSDRDDFAVHWITDAVNAGWTFDCLAAFIADQAQVSLPKNSLAGEIAMTSILNNLIQNPKPTFHKYTKLKDILDPGLVGGKTGLERLIADIKANIDLTPIASPCGITGGRTGDKSKRGSSVMDQKETTHGPGTNPNSITGEYTVQKVIDIVRSNL